MSRQISQKRSNQNLRRQHSMKTDDLDNAYIESCDFCSNSVQRQHTTSNPPNEMQSYLDYSTKRYTNQMNTYSSSGKSVSPHLLNVLNPSPSAHSSLVAVSRVSQQPSFESYDSSMSATSWTSSNDPDLITNNLRYTNDLRSLSPNQQFTNITTNRSTSPSIQERNNVKSTNNSINYGNPKQDLKITNELKSSLKSIKTKETFQSKKKNPLFRSITLDNDNMPNDIHNNNNPLSSSSSTSRLKKLSFSSQSDKKLYRSDRLFSKVLPKEMMDLKIIDMKKDGSSDLKSVTTSGSQNIKGLWKRAFHSLRKDKTDKDQIKRKENGNQSTDPQTPEGEVDPVYHLLRCAASKSQTTAVATTGIMNSRINTKTKSSAPDTSITSSNEFGQFLKSDYSEMNSYPGSILLQKASTSVTLKPNESDPRRPDEYLLEGDNNLNIINNNNNQRNKEVESNISRFNEQKSVKSNVLISSNIKLSPQKPVAEQQIVNVNEAELAYEQHKRMNPRQKTLRSNQKSPGFHTEDYPQTSFTGDYTYENEPKPFTCTDEVKPHKLFPSYNPKSFSPTIRNSREKMNTSNRMRMMSMEENEDDDADDDNNNNNYYIQENDNYQGQNTYHNTSYLRWNSSNPTISQKYPYNISSTSRKPYYNDAMSQVTTQTTNLEDTTKKNPLLSTKSFSLDVPRFDQPNDSNLTGSGGSSPGRYSEGFRKSSVVKHQYLPTRVSPSSFSPRMNDSWKKKVFVRALLTYAFIEQ
uniref:Putative cement protein 3B variant 2 n=1 Tax=Schistosoma mansoni TaxID=6183 RepID=A0A5K4EIE5_SCHMA